MVYAIHFTILQGYAVNVPYMDEWDALNPDQLPAGFSLNWLFSQHNEHRIVTTRLFTWALYKLNAWNLITHQTFNFLLYGLLLFLIVMFARKFLPELGSWVILGFILFLLSPIDWENHFWGFQMQFHFSLLFFLATVYFWYDERQRWKDILLGSTMGVLAIYSLSSGLISTFVGLLLFILYKLLRFQSASDREIRKRELQQLFLVVGLVGGAMALWFVDYHPVARHPSHTMPYTKLFWVYFVNIVGLGFGLDVKEFLPNFFFLLTVLTPIIWGIGRERGRLPNSSWAVYTAVAGILASLSVITIGRASFGVAQAKGSRYSEIAMMLIPLTVLVWALLLKERKTVRAGVLLSLWLLCFLTFQDNWYQFSQYEAAAKQRTRGVLCIERYYAGQGDGNCPSLYPAPIAAKLNEAKRLHLSFYQSIQRYVPINVPANAQTAIEKKTLYHIDTLNGQLLSRGTLVVIHSQVTPEITVAGWAVDAQAESEAADVFIVVDGKKEIPTVYGIERPDVAEVHRNPRYHLSGFSGSIPTSNLALGRHMLSVRIVRAFRDGYYEPEETIEIEVR